MISQGIARAIEHLSLTLSLFKKKCIMIIINWEANREKFGKLILLPPLPPLPFFFTYVCCSSHIFRIVFLLAWNFDLMGVQ